MQLPNTGRKECHFDIPFQPTRPVQKNLYILSVSKLYEILSRATFVKTVTDGTIKCGLVSTINKAVYK